LVGALDHIKTRNLAVHSLLVVRHGYVVLDAYFYPYTGETAHDVASVTKSITASLIGVAIEKGYLKSLDQPVLDLLPERTAADPFQIKRRIAVKHLLSMSGFKSGSAPGEPELFAMIRSKDWVQFALDLPMAARPGTEFAYCSCNTHVLSAILTRTTGMSTLNFARQHLFGPLAITQVFWPADPQGITHGWGDLQMHPHDMAKIGYLYLRGGRWGERQVLSPDWIAMATQKQVPLPGGRGGYGYGWWISSGEFSGMYAAKGRGGQRIIVWPKKDVVIVITAGGVNPDGLVHLLVRAVRSEETLRENPASYRRLQEVIAEAARPPVPKPISSLPRTALEISGKVYHLAPNKLGVKTSSLTFDTLKEAQFSVSSERGDAVMAVGLDGVYRFTTGGVSNLPVAVKGFWATDNTFVIDYNEVGRINHFTIRMTFDGPKVAVRVDDPTFYFTQTMTGRVQD